MAHRTVALLATLLAAVAVPASAADLVVAEPTSAAPAKARSPERSRWGWNQLQARAGEQGDLGWAPQPFAFTPGKSKRYIDYDGGDDTRDGATPETAWKHHPWDDAATGIADACKGVHTYVFKRGVSYRGTLRPSESGVAGDPIRLTSDPAWGSGDAAIVGSDAVTGWKQGAPHADIPDAAKVWWVDLPFAPRRVWEVRDGTVQRLALARTPNWTASDPDDPMKGWYQWENPEWWTGKHKTRVGDAEMHLGVDTQHLTGPATKYVGGLVWTEYGIVMGTPFAANIEAYDPEKKAIAFQGTWFGASGTISQGHRYFLEDRPHHLDAPGEFWFERQGDGGRLYARLPDDRDPNGSRIEASRRIALIDSAAMSHVEITGLAFRFTDVFWDLTARWFTSEDVNGAAIRLIGSGKGIRIANCRFEHVNRAVRMKAKGGTDLIDGVVIADNEIRHADQGAIRMSDGDTWAKIHPPTGKLRHVEIVRNRLHDIGGRAVRSEHGHATEIDFAETLHLAGNSMDRCYGSAIFVFGGRAGGIAEEAPLSRTLIHHNRVQDALLAANDWGAIETWMGGPHYVYGNISGNPSGYWHWKAMHKPRGESRLGFAYYFDGSYKNYIFNNVAWGKSSDPMSPLTPPAAFYFAGPTVENWLFQNTAARFFMGTQWSPRNGRGVYLGNVFSDLSSWAISHGAVKEDAGPVVDEYPHHTIAYDRNVFHRVAPELALIEAAGSKHAGVDTVKAVLEKNGAVASGVGAIAESDPLRDSARNDFRPKPGGAAVDAGAKVFVPWSLARTVGEWHFRRDNADPTRIHDHHWFMTAYALGNFAQLPRYDLTGVGVGKEHFTAGPLEDWTAGALVLDGASTWAVLPHDRASKPFEYQYPLSHDKSEKRVAEGEALQSPDIHRSNLLVELHVQVAKPGCVLVAKLSPEAGYQVAVNQAGGVTFTVRGGGKTAELAAGARIADGKWHHVLVELDRGTDQGAVHVDGLRVAEGAMALPKDASLANGADLLVGRGPDGHHAQGAIEFLRICRATLAESRTSIEELYDWEFDGPFLRDLLGADPAGRRDAGAYESMATGGTSRPTR